MKNINNNYYHKTEKVKKQFKINWLILHKTIIYSHCISILVAYLLAIGTLSRQVISNNLIYIIIASVSPIICWIWSTNTKEGSFHDKKIFFYYVAIINAMATIMQPLYTLIWKPVTKHVFEIPVTAAMTEGMIILLAQLILVASMGILVTLIVNFLKPLIFSEDAINKIKYFKLRHKLDMRKNKENLYDLKIVRDLKTGEVVLIKYWDRFVHMLVNGASGTGKTSSVYLPAIKEDLDKKVQNKEKREAEFLQMLLKHEAYMQGPLRKFDEYAVRPKKGFEKKYKEIWAKYPDAGITLLAPNNSVIESVIKLCEARELTVHVLDPAKKYEQYKYVKNVGLNPFYIPLGLDEDERENRIIEAANNTAEVLQAINERYKVSDQYFAEVNKAATSNISTVLMLASNITGCQTNIKEVQRCINNFGLLKRYVDIIEKHFDIKVEPLTIQNTKGTSSKQADVASLNSGVASLNASERSEKGINNRYYEQLLFVKTELLGIGSEKMYDQARGLRNLINKLLQDSRIRAMLTATDEQVLNLDESFLKNQIVLVNTALEYGPDRSTALGLFFLQSQKAAVVRRPEETRTPHFLFIDEVAQYLHPVMEDFVTLYRQYMVAVTMAIQSHAQMERTSITQYLKDVFMTVGTHIAFGRLSPKEMKIYQEMGGIYEEEVAQKTISETSLLSDNPSLSTSERVTPTQKNKVSGSEMRYLDFQEVTLLGVDEGRVSDARFCKVSFLEKEDYAKVNIKKINWEKVKPNVEIIDKPVAESSGGNTEKENIPEIEKETRIAEHIVLPTEHVEKNFTQRTTYQSVSSLRKKEQQEETRKSGNIEVVKKDDETEIPQKPATRSLAEFFGDYNNNPKSDEDDVMDELRKMNQAGRR